jgi:hypothetical protein
VHDAVGVRLGQRIGDLSDEIDDAARVHRPAADRRGERLAGHELAGEKQLALIFANFVQLGDVRMRQLGCGSRILDEALALLRVGGDVRADYLDRDRAPEPRVARTQYFAKAAGADAVEDLVLAERLNHVARLY